MDRFADGQQATQLPPYPEEIIPRQKALPPAAVIAVIGALAILPIRKVR